MFFENNGNVGIGTTNPKSKLELNGNLWLFGAGDGSKGSYINLVNTGIYLEESGSLIVKMEEFLGLMI